jgi:hypothetical protein
MLEDFIKPTSADAAKAGQPDVIDQSQRRFRNGKP